MHWLCGTPVTPNSIDHEKMIEVVDVAEIANHKPIGRNGLAVADRKIIEYRDIVAAVEELLDGVTANVACATRHQDTCHRNSRRAR